MTTSPRRAAALAGAVMTALLGAGALSACDPLGGGSASPTATTMSEAEILAIGLEAVQCFRDNGVPTIPDPILENGRLIFPDGVEEQIEQQYSQQLLDQAQRACQPIIDRLPQAAVGGDPGTDLENPPGPEDIEAMRRFAACMRENGVPDWPDPQSDGSWPDEGPLATEGKSPRVLAGFDACRQHWPGSFAVS
jgi:hypothetical protein